MAKIIKVRCNGPGKHVNEIDPVDLVEGGNTTVYRFAGHASRAEIQDEYVLRCNQCAGQVIIAGEDVKRCLSED